MSQLKIADPKIISLLYQMMYDIHQIFTIHNIDYWLDGGSFLGAIRHKGIIPWDDDVDVGFIKSEWNKLSKLKTIFEKNGLKYTAIKSNAGKAGSTHCHFGTIDCFLLSDIPGEYYAGDAKTFCHKEEYKNIWPGACIYKCTILFKKIIII